MAESILTYVLNLEGNLQAKLKQIGISNDQQLATWAKVQQQVSSATQTMNNMGRSMGSIKERIAALQAQREWIPASNREAIRASNVEMKKLNAELKKMEQLNGGKMGVWWGQLKSAVPAIGMLANPLTIASAGVYKLSQYLGASKQAYMEESVQVSKLVQVMGNTMGARSNEVSSVLDLTSAQQKLGVISAGVQLAGAQELSTYLTKKESLEKLLPAMNDMLAQQYGLNATQEQAAGIASMMGKVMDGQVGALSRYGYKFSEAQEHILKTGTEAQRAAVLFDVVSSAVGGVNEALAQTPEGKLAQQANSMADLQNRVGKLVVAAQSAFAPLIAAVGDVMDGIVGFFEKNEQKIQQLLGGISSLISNVLVPAIAGVLVAISPVLDAILYFFAQIDDGNPIMVSFAVVIGAITAAYVLYSTWQKIVSGWTVVVTFFKSGEAAAWWAATVPMLITIGIIAAIIAAIVAIVATIVYCVKHVTGWGDTWRNVVEYIKLSFTQMGAWMRLKWLQISDTFLTGFEVIKMGWYKLQSLWNKDAASEGLAKIQADRDKRAAAIAEAQGKVEELAKTREQMTVWALKTDGTSFSDFIKGAKDKVLPALGTNTALQQAVGGKDDGAAGGGGAAAQSSTEAIATGGTRNTSIYITVKSMIESLNMNGGTGENARDIENNIAEAFYRVLNMASVSAK